MAVIVIVGGLVLLVWSADWFVDGAATTARHFGMPPLLIGMLVVGFGTSTPELLVSGLAAQQGNAGIALGNAYGSNITNIALILGITALIRPIAVHSRILRQELPVLAAVTALAAWQVYDARITRPEAIGLLIVFAGLMAWTIRTGLRRERDAFGHAVAAQVAEHQRPLRRALIRLAVGFAVLIASSRALVWGAVDIAQMLGISDLVIGLTVVAVGTSLPELAASIVAARKGEHDIALGNILGSNLFNTLAVVGLAGGIAPLAFGPEVLTRDVATMGALTGALFLLGYGFAGPGRINRAEGALLVTAYLGYNIFLFKNLAGG